MLADFIIKNAREVVTTTGASSAPLAGANLSDITVIPDGVVAAKDGMIVDVGPAADVLSSIEQTSDCIVIDAEDRCVIPGLVDPHTHLLFAGSREDEFAMRAAGKSYMEIMQAGGGLYRTVSETRAASFETLKALGRKRLDLLLRQGSTTVEIKSGYGLTTDSELAMLRCGQALANEAPTTIVNTFLGAHAVPPEYKETPDDYVQLVVEDMIPAVVKNNLAVYCDIFCEKGVLSYDQSKIVMDAAAKAGLKLKVHGNELGHSGGVKLANDVKAVSVDHCNFLSDDDIGGMQRSGVIAVGLPGTPFFRLAPQYADGRKIIDAGIPIALATDYNPTASISSMFFVMFLACLEMKMTPVEVLNASTINAAHTIDLAADIGSLEKGKRADLLIVDVDDFRLIPFNVGRDLVDVVVKSGKPVCGKRFDRNAA